MLGGNFKVANNDDNPFVYVDWSPNLGIRVQELKVPTITGQIRQRKIEIFRTNFGSEFRIFTQ